MIEFDRNRPLPYYYQLKTILLEKIQAPDWDASRPLPTERELQESFRVSRSVVRQALNELVNEGYVVRQQGRGTFVTPQKIRHDPQGDGVRSHGLSGYLKSQGLEPRCQLLSKRQGEPDPRAARALQLGTGAQVLRFERLRLAGETPIGIHTVTLPWSLGQNITDDDMVYGESSLDYLKDRLRIDIGESNRTIEAISLGDGLANLFDVEPGMPALRVRRVVNASSGEAVEYMEAVYRADSFEYHLNFRHG